MPKIPPHKPREVIKKFKKLGYVIDHQKGSHVVLYNSELKKIVVVPMHIKDMPKGTLLAIIKEAGLTKEEFMAIK